MALYAALIVTGVDEELALAAVDDWRPVAASSADTSGDVDVASDVTIFFATPADRDGARAALISAFPAATISPIDVDDEDWARRSQENLGPIVVERITVRPGDSDRLETAGRQRPITDGSQSLIDLVIQPSMGFGTGHHATTRLCLAALQQVDVRGRFMLDIGTGSGILALAARALGAERALGLDYDPDAIKSAEENLPLNPYLDHVSFAVFDLTHQPLPQADVVTANLTGALLCRTAPLLWQSVAAGGVLILSGILDVERDAVVDAFRGLPLAPAPTEAREDEWVALCFNLANHTKV